MPARRRAEIMARTEIIRAHHQATIMEYQNWAVEGIKVKAEWATAQDNRVCPQCAPLEGEIFPLETAMNMIPVHPSCRCIALPYKDKSTPTPTQVKSEVVRDNSFKQGSLPFRYANLLKSENAAAAEYQHGMYNSDVGGFSSIQRYLRNKTIPDWLRKDGVTAKKLQGYIDDMSSAISKSVVAEDGVVYRGIRNTAEAFNITDKSLLKPGFRFTDKGFSSTTSSRIADKFADKLNHWEDPRILRIQLKEGQAALPMDMINAIGEKEIVLPSGLRFEITKMTGKYIDLKIVK